MTDRKQTVILFSAFYEPYLSGAERFVQEVVERLGTRYHFVLFTCRMSRGLSRREERPWGEIRRVGWGTPADKWLYPVLAPLAALRVNARIAHAVMESYAGIALWIFGCLKPVVRRILTLQSGDLDQREKQRRIPSWLWRKIHTSPDEITAISRFLAERATRLGVPSDRVKVIPNGVDLDETAAVRRESRVRVPGRIVCVARLSEEKGIETLIRALGDLRQSNPNAHLVLVGDGPLRLELESLVRSLGLSGAVTFRGAFPHRDALREIATAGVFACPSLAEGLGIVFIEAQALGTPAIGTRVGGISDVIEDGRTGLLVPPGDPAALASAIKRIFDDRALALRISADALREIERFDWNRIAESVAGVYETLLSFPWKQESSLDPRLRGDDRKEKGGKMVIATGIYPPEIGGPATYSRTLAAGLASRGWSVSMVTYGDPSVPRDVPDGTRLCVVSRAGGPLIRYVRYAMAVSRESQGANLIYLLDPVSSGLPGTVAAVMRRIPTVLKVVGDYAWEQGQARGVVNVLLNDFQTFRAPFAIEAFRMIQRIVARRARRIIVPSQYLAGIVQCWGIPHERITVIPNAVHLPSPGGPETPTKERAPVVISAGRFLPWKGMETLVRCFPKVRERLPEARLVLVGDGPARFAIERSIGEVGGQRWVELAGRMPQDKLHERIRSAAVFALVSGYEGFSHQIIEAMALGTPIVASSAGGNPEAIRDGENGVLVPFGDEQRTAAAIIGLLTDRSRAATLAAAAREDAKQYTEERMVEATSRLLSEIS